MNDPGGGEMLMEARGLHKSFASGNAMLRVLKGVDLGLYRGEICSIIGPSGAGKSTLLHILGTLDRPDSGTVALKGRDLFMISDNARSRVRNLNIGFVFQFYHLLPEFTAIENVVMPALVFGKAADRRGKRPLERAAELLSAVGLGGRMHHKPAELSGGEQQRVAIARALVNDPILVLADEPSGNLDSGASSDLHRLIGALNRERGQAFVIVTHDEDLAAIAHRRFKMADGKILAAE